MKHRPIVIAALKIAELEYQLVNINAVDDKLEPDVYLANISDQEIINEAEWRLSGFFEYGHDNNDRLNGEDKNERADARKNVRQLYAFLKKYKPVGQPKAWEYPNR